MKAHTSVTLGYPAYLLPFLGAAKMLGVAAILAPGVPRMNEWAFAGLTFDLAGALYSHLSVGDPPRVWMPSRIQRDWLSERERRH